MRIFGYKPMSTWDKMENIMKIIEASSKTNQVLPKGNKTMKINMGEKTGKTIDRLF